MIRMKRKTLIKSIVGIGFLLISLLVLSIFVNDDKFKYTVTKSEIDNLIKQKLPLVREIDIKGNFPDSLRKHFINPTIEIVTVETSFVKDSIEILINGEFKYMNKNIPLTILAKGLPEYKNYSIYFKATEIKVQINELSPSKLIQDTLFSSSLTNNLFNFLSEKANKFNVFNNEEFKSKLDASIDYRIEKTLINFVLNKPLYTLKESVQSKNFVIGLSHLAITNDGIVVEISIAEIFMYLTILFSIIILIFTILYYIVKNPSDVFFGFIEVSVDILGEGLSGVAEIASGL